MSLTGLRGMVVLARGIEGGCLADGDIFFINLFCRLFFFCYICIANSGVPDFLSVWLRLAWGGFWAEIIPIDLMRVMLT